MRYNDIIVKYGNIKRLNESNKNLRSKEESEKIQIMIRDFETTCDEIVKKIQSKK